MACSLLIILALCTDIRKRIIPNTLTIPAIFFGIIFNMLISGWYDGMLFSVKGMLTGCCLLIIPFILGGMGGGDVKLLAAIGAWLGCMAVLNIFLFGSVTGAFIALAMVFFKNQRLNLMNILNDILFFILTKKRVVPTKNSGNFPYSIPIAVGFLIYILCCSFDFLILTF